MRGVALAEGARNSMRLKGIAGIIHFAVPAATRGCLAARMRIHDAGDGNMSTSLAALSDPACPLTRISVEDEYCSTAQRYHRRLCATAFRILRNQDEAEDVVQEAHLHALTHLDQFEGRAALSTWLTQIVINHALMRLRRRVPSVDLDEVILRSTGPNPEQQAVRTQLGALIYASIQGLPARYRTAFFVSHVCGLSAEQTAPLLGVTVGCIKTRLHRAKALLRKALRVRLVGWPLPARKRRRAYTKRRRDYRERA